MTTSSSGPSPTPRGAACSTVSSSATAARSPAGLVVTRRSGREKHHFLNPVPIRLIHDRWIDKFTEPRVSALADLKAALEEESA
jgi:hypothetical protein